MEQEEGKTLHLCRMGDERGKEKCGGEEMIILTGWMDELVLK